MSRHTDTTQDSSASPSQPEDHAEDTSTQKSEVDNHQSSIPSFPSSNQNLEEGGSSYRQIFKATSILGGAQVVTIIIGIARNKAMALLLGPSGIGLAGTFLTVTGMVEGITQLGIGPSGVRQIAEASGINDQTRIARTAITLRRISFVTGLLGLTAGLALALPLSHLTFGDASRASELRFLALTLLVGSISAGQWALLQGLRRLGDLAKSQIWGACWGAIGSIVIVFIWREQGIAPYLVVNALITLWFSRWYARKVPLHPVTLRWAETWPEARPVLALGVTFVLQNLTLAAGAYFSRVLIINEIGLAAVGLYTAAYTLSTYYVQLILKAMTTDFYPRLTAVANDPVTMNRMVNEQIEMGILMATPGVLGILALAPWILQVLYSNDFVAAEGVIRWMILGVFVQVISWPVGTIILAKNRKKIFVSSQILSATLGVGLLALALPRYGLEGIGIASATSLLLYGSFIVVVGYNALTFRLNRRAVITTIASCSIVVAGFCISCFLKPQSAFLVGIVLATVSFVVAVLLLQNRLRVNIRKYFQDLRG